MYFANHTSSGTIGNDQDSDNNESPVSDVIINGNPNDDQEGIDIDLTESAATQVEEARELMVLDSAKHI